MKPFIIALIAAFSASAAALAAEPRVLVDKAAFPEGPAFIDGKLHYVEYSRNTLMTWDGKTAVTLWKLEGCGPSAVAPFGADLLVTCYDNGTIARVSKDGRMLATYDKAEDGTPLSARTTSRLTARAASISRRRGPGSRTRSSAGCLT